MRRQRRQLAQARLPPLERGARISFFTRVRSSRFDPARLDRTRVLLGDLLWASGVIATRDQVTTDGAGLA